MSRDEGYSAFQDAFANLRTESGAAPERMGAVVTVKGFNASSDVDFTVDMLVDGGEGLFIVTMEGEGFSQGRGAAGGQNPFGGGKFVTAQAWKTTFFGSDVMLVGRYNESAEPPSGLEDTKSGPQGASGAEAFVGEIMDLAKDDVASVEPVTYDGRAAIEIRVERVKENATLTGRVIVYTDPALPALVDARVQDPDAKNEWERDASMRVEFRYGEDAEHALETPVKRLETMTLLNESNAQDPFGFGGGGSNGPYRNLTVQPAHFTDHRVPLDKVEARAWPSEGGGGASGNGTRAPALVLPLEDGSAENEDVRFTFQDKDEDGKVSTGDVLVVEYLTDKGHEYQVGLFDEETGLALVPAPGLLVAFALVALGAVATRGRRG